MTTLQARYGVTNAPRRAQSAWQDVDPRLSESEFAAVRSLLDAGGVTLVRVEGSSAYTEYRYKEHS